MKSWIGVTFKVVWRRDIGVRLSPSNASITNEEEDAVMVPVVAWEVIHYPFLFTFFFLFFYLSLFVFPCREGSF